MSAATRYDPIVAGDGGLRLRPYRPGDAEALVALYVRSVTEIGRNDCTPAQVSAWAALAPTPVALDDRYGDGRIALVAVDATNAAVAFGDVEPDGHITYLYRVPGCRRRFPCAGHVVPEAPSPMRGEIGAMWGLNNSETPESK